MPTKEGILSWLLEAKTNGASHVVVVCDTFDYEDYPVEVLPDEDVHAVVAKNNNPDHMSNVMEVYWLDGDIDAQLAMPSSFTYGPAEPGSQD
ncbi:MAG: hypothetical protein JWN38_987 [Candidatus Saccharibacteria bacterium]|nr:hypothetical protein [Candidatus Saccharibacteria bacterium]